jgi:dipeptide/tripeptide permease
LVLGVVVVAFGMLLFCTELAFVQGLLGSVALAGTFAFGPCKLVVSEALLVFAELCIASFELVGNMQMELSSFQAQHKLDLVDQGILVQELGVPL